MRWLLFMNRVALICNLCCIATFVVKQIKGIDEYQYIVGTLIILGYVMPIVLNTSLALITTIAYSIGKKHIIPKFLFVINMIFFLLQFYFFIISK